MSSASPTPAETSAQTMSVPTLFGHPTGLFTLFFAEMWERFSFYGMRALLVFYMTKGFLSYPDGRAYTVYGAYTSLVYMTPFFGGLLADRLLGQRLAVIIGGTLMALGHLVMTVENSPAFYLALTLLILGNGFFKPNISTIVGSLYPSGSSLRDGGFTIFYMGVNLGAAMIPLLCGYIGETWGWHWGFGLATFGMLAGLAVFVVPNRISQLLIAVGAAAAAFGLIRFRASNTEALLMNAFVALCLITSAAIAIVALNRGGLPASAGAPRNGKVSASGFFSVIGGVIVLVPVIALFVSGFSLIRTDQQPVQIISSAAIDRIRTEGGSAVAAIFLEEVSKPAGMMLTVIGALAFSYLIFQTMLLPKVARQRMTVVLTLTFFSMLFWAFFELAGSSLSNFTDRNVDRVSESRLITAEDVGQTIRLQPTQEQLGYTNGDLLFTMDQLNTLRSSAENSSQIDFEIDWKVHSDNVGMGIAPRSAEQAAASFQAVNAICILLFGLPFAALWTSLAKRRLEPSTPVKFALGLLQLALGFAAFWYGARHADSRGMVAAFWLILGYALHTTGELCLSPVGLSMVTKLSPKVLVSTVMGGWFLATAFSQYLAAIISQFTNVSEGGGGDAKIPIPAATVNIYGDVFGKVAVIAFICGGICLLLAPLLQKWMHQNLPDEN